MYGATFLRTEKYVCDISLQLVLTSTRGCCLHFFANIKYIFSCDIYLLIPVCEKPADSVFKNKWEKCIESTWFFFFTWFFGLSFGGLKTASLHIPNKTLYEASYQANWLLQKSHPYRDKWVKRTHSIRITDTFNLVLWYLVRYCTKNCAKNCVKNSPLFVNNMSHQLCKKE